VYLMNVRLAARVASAQAAWKSANAYSRLNGAKCVHVLKRLNGTYLDKKMEQVTIESPLTWST
jgi:hypothetical protein